jgi:hypothetical protein
MMRDGDLCDRLQRHPGCVNASDLDEIPSLVKFRRLNGRLLGSVWSFRSHLRSPVSRADEGVCKEMPIFAGLCPPFLILVPIFVDALVFV